MDSNIQDNYSILKQLEWDLFKKSASRTSLFKESAEKIFNNEINAADLKKTFDLTEFFLLPEHSDEIIEIFSKIQQIDKDVFPRHSGKKLEKNAFFDLPELAGLIRLLEITFEHISFFSNLLNPATLKTAKEFQKEFKKQVLREFRTFVTAQGAIDYFKHPKLKSLRKSQVELEAVIRTTLAKLRQSERYQKVLQFESHDIINDKYILPVKSDAFNSSLGAIVARSESGRTLFVEPASIKNLNRERFEILLKIDHVIHEITRDFCKRLAPWSASIDALIACSEIFDEFKTRAQFALDMKLSRPVLLKTPGLRLESFFHPLIKKPVKNNLNLEAGSKGLVISGPNTGGKTAAIKAVALCFLFIKRGLFVPARSAELHLFENIFYFGNDQQSLPEGLSSFSAEVKNYSRMLEGLGQSNLIIIDEIFSSTSSEEASALALALFNEITKDEGSKIIVSTHHQTLKTLAHSQQEYISCHVGFDSEKNEPTYKLIYGSPGGSLALEVFKKLSQTNPMGERIYRKALSKLDNKMVNYEKLLQALSLKESKLNNLLRANENLRQELKSQKASAKGLIQLRVDDEVEKIKKELGKISEEADSFLSQVKSGNVSNKNRVHKKLSSLESQLAPFKSDQDDISKRRAERFNGLKKPEKLVVGQKYYCGFVNQIVTLQEIKSDKEALVSRGALKIKSPLEALRLPDSGKEKSEVTVTAIRSTEARLEYDCRGMRLSEFQNLVENITPDLIAGNVPFINIIHGHGDGILKKWIRDHVRTSKSLEWDRTESGNDGETRLIVSL
ncbi:MAG: Smr/MutS family protein [Bacteriovoracaceae bacterium]